jgi:hypothetical protein
MPNYVRMVVPMLVCLDPAAEIDFCKAAFGAVELSRRSPAVLRKLQPLDDAVRIEASLLRASGASKSPNIRFPQESAPLHSRAPISSLHKIH